jgi:protein NRD1
MATVTSTTPAGSPPPGPGFPGLPAPASASDNKTSNPNAIMEALANIARQTAAAKPMNSSTTPIQQQNPYGMPAQYQQQQQPPPPVPVTQSQPAFPFAAAHPPPQVSAAPAPYAYPQQPTAFPGLPPALPVTTSSQPSGFPAGAVPGAAQDPALAQQVQFIQLLMAQGIPADKIPALLATLQNGAPGVAPPAASAPPAFPQQQGGQTQYPGAWGPPPPVHAPGPRPEDARDHAEYNGGLRSPNRYRGRSRSRSPQGRNWGGSRDSPRGRNDRGFDAYGRESPGRGRDQHRSEYRQRSPAGYRGRSASPGPGQGSNGQKWVDFDRTLPAEHIKVLSRTLFVGGVT